MVCVAPAALNRGTHHALHGRNRPITSFVKRRPNSVGRSQSGSSSSLPRSAIAAPVARARASGWLEDDPDWLRPTELGRRFTNDVIGLFLP